MKLFSKKWKSSKKAKKQRKYRYNAPLHIKGKFLSCHLNKQLRDKYKTRSIRVRVGDKVKIMRGQFKGREGKVEKVDVKKTKVYITKMEMQKKDGSKTLYPLDPSNLLIMEMETSDKKRLKHKAGA